MRNSFPLSLICLAIALATWKLELGIISKLFLTMGILLMIISKTRPWSQAKPMYGRLTEDLVITKDAIILKNIIYSFKNIQDFQIQLRGYHDNSSPWHSEKGHMKGVDNSIFFITDDIIVREHFLISSGTEFATLQTIVDQVICKEKIPFKHRYLDMVSDSYKQTEEYRQLIQKIKHKNPTFVF